MVQKEQFSHLCNSSSSPTPAMQCCLLNSVLRVTPLRSEHAGNFYFFSPHWYDLDLLGGINLWKDQLSTLWGNRARSNIQLRIEKEARKKDWFIQQVVEISSVISPLWNQEIFWGLISLSLSFSFYMYA